MTTTAYPANKAISETLSEAKQQVRDNPADAAPRIYLFQLLAVEGEWNRAKSQLEICGDLDPGALAMVQTYREALACEAFRESVFAGKSTPLVFGEPAQWMASLIEAVRLEAQGEHAAAQELRDTAFEAAPTTSGSISFGEEKTDVDFEWIADADPRLGPSVEAIINGKYYWVPWNNVKQLHIEAPNDLRDFVWTPVFFEWANGGESAGLIPTRYPGSERSDDDAICLAKKTVWDETTNGSYHGLGQRMLATDVDEFPLMDVRNIKLNSAPEGNATADAEKSQDDLVPEGN